MEGNGIWRLTDYQLQETLLQYSDAECESSSDESDHGNISSEGEQKDVLVAEEWRMEGNVPSPSFGRFQFTKNVLTNNKLIVGEAIDYFKLFFTDELIELIVEETNYFAEQSGEKDFETEANEIKLFLALNMLQGIVVKPSYYYWTKNPLLETPFFRNCMARQRFEIIEKYLHFSNNETYDENTHPFPKLNKIWPVYMNLNEKFKHHFSLQRDVSIDESVIEYKGKPRWRQLFTNERAVCGTNLYMLCDSETGYVWNTMIYTGRESFSNKDYIDIDPATQIVLTLMEPLLDKGHSVTAGSFYTSLELAKSLILRKTDIYGIAKVDGKGMPKALTSKTKLRNGESIALRKGQILVIKWNGNKELCLLSTFHTSENVAFNVKNEVVVVPRIVQDYNLAMEGVERVDQTLATFAKKRKRGKKYYTKFFFHLLELAVYNAFVIYEKNGQKKDHLGFRLELICQLVGNHDPLDSSLEEPLDTANTPIRLLGRHFPSKYVGTGKTRNPQRVCVLCSRLSNSGKRFRKETRYECVDCDVGLCVSPCFKVYHTKADI